MSNFRQLQYGCNNNKHSIDPLDLNDIQSIQPMNPITDRQGMFVDIELNSLTVRLLRFCVRNEVVLFELNV